MTMGIEIGMTEGARDSVTGVVDRFDELRDDMNNGFSKLRKNVEEMDADELRRDIQSLMIIGNAQMEVIRDQREKIDSMSSDMREMESEKVDAIGKAAEANDKAADAEEKLDYLNKRLAQSNRDVDRLAAENEAYSRIVREFPRLSACMLVVAIVEAVALCLALIF